MKASHFFQALALSSVFLASLANACGLRDNGATMTDPVTGIEIRKCAEGQTYQAGQCKGFPNSYTRDEALQRFGSGTWRLITVEEARQILPRSGPCPIDGQTSWTSSSVSNSNLFWAVAFYNRVPLEYQSKIRLPVILVRDGSTSRADITTKAASQTDLFQSNLDTPERLQAAQANQQQADRAFAGKKRVHDDNANTEQPTTGSREGTATNRGPVRVNVAYCFDSYKRAYSGNLKCSAQRFGYISLEPGQTVDVLGPNSGLQALTMGCKHPTKPYDVEFVNDGLSGRCAPY